MKKRTLTIKVIIAVLTFTFILIAQSADKQLLNKVEITIREQPPQIMLYTIVRGPYQKPGPAVSQLFAQANKNGIRPMGSPAYSYLNNPKLVSSEHFLTEIRIPVGDEALKLAGTLGEMTDVKKVPAMTVAVVVKPKGISDPAPIYEKVYTWVYKNEYRVIDSPSEKFLINGEYGDYAQIKSEIITPIEKISECDK